MTGMSGLVGAKRIITGKCVPSLEHARSGIYQGAITEKKEYNKRNAPAGVWPKTPVK